MACVNCGSGLCFECKNIVDGICCCNRASVNKEMTELDEPITESRRIDTYKRDSTLKDQQSTGRKRAAALYPLDRTAPCEWRGLRNAGGGQFPIVGCSAGTQQARHHGPDKNTLNNEEGNVHRICHRCHNRWHTKNDPGYEWGNPGQPHDPFTKAETDEIIESELYWQRNKTVKAKD